MGNAITNFFDWIVNTNPLVVYVNGHKTEIAGIVASTSVFATGLATVFPVYSVALLAYAAGALKVAGWIGVVGVTGKLVKSAKA